MYYRVTVLNDIPIDLEVSTTGSDYDTVLGIYAGQKGSLFSVGCNDDADGLTTSRVKFSAVSTVNYYIVVTSYNGFGGDLMLSIHP